MLSPLRPPPVGIAPVGIAASAPATEAPPEEPPAVAATIGVTNFISAGSATNMYWTVAQIVTHHASGGCNLQPGDLLGTGTISAPEDTGFGSLLEISRGGKQPLTLPTGETRSFLADGDELTLSARASAEGFASIGFGRCSGVVLAARA